MVAVVWAVVCAAEPGVEWAAGTAGTGLLQSHYIYVY